MKELKKYYRQIKDWLPCGGPLKRKLMGNITATIEGSCEIGMSSRALKDEELAGGLTEITMAMDGIAVIINRENPTENLTSEEIRKIFVGEITSWDQLGG